MMPPPHRAWSEVHHSVAASQRADVAGMMNERALTLASGMLSRVIAFSLTYSHTHTQAHTHTHIYAITHMHTCTRARLNTRTLART